MQLEPGQDRWLQVTTATTRKNGTSDVAGWAVPHGPAARVSTLVCQQRPTYQLCA